MSFFPWADKVKSFFFVTVVVEVVDFSMFMVKLKMTSFERWWRWRWQWRQRNAMHTTNQLQLTTIPSIALWLLNWIYVIVATFQSAFNFKRIFWWSEYVHSITVVLYFHVLKVLIFQLQWVVYIWPLFSVFRSFWMLYRG